MRKKGSFLRRFAKWFKRAQPEPEKASQIEGHWADTEVADIADDSFYFQDYARVLKDRIVSVGTPDTPFTIGVFGRWGSGKTSLMKLVDCALPKETKNGDRLRSIWINVWQLSNRDEVWQAFLQVLFSEVHRRLSLWRRIDKGKLLRQLVRNSYRIVLTITPMIVGVLLAKPETGWGDVLRLVLNPIAGGGTLVTVGLGLWTLVKPIVESAREVVSIDLQSALKYAPYEAQVTELMQLQKRFEKTVKVLVGEHGLLVVFVDDLDRCSPDKVSEILEALKLFTATSRCVYVMGLDHDLTRQAIVKKYKFSEEEGAEYLEKIFQIPFHLPPLEDDRIAAFVRKNYPDVCQKCRWAPEVFSLGLERNPRKVKRVLNIYRTLLDLSEERVKAWEMDPVAEELVAKMIVIQSRFRALHEHLVRHPYFLLQVEERCHYPTKEIKSDEEVGWILLGKPEEARESEAETHLINEAAWPALSAMLSVGEKRFSDDDQRDQITSYIYLTSTAEGGVERVRPSREERDVLLGADRAAIEELVRKILRRGENAQAQLHITQTYIKRLEGVVAEFDRYTPSERLFANLAIRLLQLRCEHREFELEMLHIPAGPFLMGTPKGQVDELIKLGGFSNIEMEFETPQHEVTLDAYAISRYPVTNADFAHFIEDDGYTTADYWTEAGWKEKESRGWTQPRYWEDEKLTDPDQPVVDVSWYEAVAYCKWLTAKTSYLHRLPSEAEWEKAARSTDERPYPWGNELPDERRCNFGNNVGRTTPVGQYSPQGDSPYGCADMAGNVWEWTRSLWGKDSSKPEFGYPYDAGDGRENLEAGGEVRRVLRGGSWVSLQGLARCAVRLRRIPGSFDSLVGFRVVVSLVFGSSEF